MSKVNKPHKPIKASDLVKKIMKDNTDIKESKEFEKVLKRIARKNTKKEK
jgi:hypothetical protein